MFCIKCGCEMSEDEKFCGKCGASQIKDETSKVVTHEEQNRAYESNIKDIHLIDPEEQIIATLGNGFGVNLLYGNAERCYAVLTNKRVYFGGALYTGYGDMLHKINMEQIVDLEDITGTGFLYSKISKWMIIWGIITLPTIVIGLILLIKAFFDRKTFFFVQYAGGCVNFDAHLIGMADVRDFHTQIRRVKDKLKK